MSMRIIEADLRRIETPEALQVYLGYVLRAPDWYGRNLDALYDILTEGFPRIPAMVNWLQNFGKPKEDPEDPEGNPEKIMAGITAFLILVQTVAVFSLLFTNPYSVKKEKMYALSGEQEFCVAPGKNIIVLILNYVFSRFFVFTSRDRKKRNDEP